jgi:hypothetical protein
MVDAIHGAREIRSPLPKREKPVAMGAPAPDRDVLGGQGGGGSPGSGAGLGWDEAAPESNRPSRGLHDRTGF